MALIAVAMCWVVVWIGVRGIELSVTVSSIMAIAKMGVLIIFGLMGIVYGIKNGFANDFSLKSWIPSWDDTIVYVAVIVYNLLGFELIGSIGSKIKNPSKTVPKMTIIAGVAITFLYAFGTFGVLSAISASNVDEVDGFVYALQELCSIFGGAQMPVFYALMLVSILTLANMITWTLGGNESFMIAGLDKRSKFSTSQQEVWHIGQLYYIMGVVSTLLIILNYALSGDANDLLGNILFASIVFMLNYLFMFLQPWLKYTDDTPREIRPRWQWACGCVRSYVLRRTVIMLLLSRLGSKRLCVLDGAHRYNLLCLLAGYL